MEWLKEILEKAAVTDGRLDVEAVMKAVSTVFPKHAVPKKDYDDTLGELKIANDTITQLKKENNDNEELQKKIGDYEKEIETLKQSEENTKKEYALKEKLTAAGALDADYLIFKQGGIEKFSFDKEGKPVGIEDMVKPIKEASPHLFKAEPGADYHPAGGGNPPAGNPFAKDTYNLTEQGRLLNSNPEQARILAAAAGVEL